jgi:phospholipid/cholesterol/gamma-HCH transport system substrate-binding protein
MRRQVPAKHLVSAFGLLAILLVTVTYLYGGILGESVTKRPLHVTVSMERTGGLYEGSGVSYRGVRVGAVDDIRISGDGVEVAVSIDPDTRIPRDSAAVVRTLSPAGEQFLDFQPAGDSGPYLRSGSRVAAAKTSTPTSVASALTAVDRLMSQVDAQDLRTVLDELHAAFAKPEDLGRIVDSGSSILTTLDELWPQTLRTLQNGRTVLHTGSDLRDEFRTFATSAKSLTAWLDDYDPRLRAILVETPAQVEQMRRLVSVLGLKLPAVLGDIVSITDLLADRDPHLRALLQTFPTGLKRLADTIKDGRLQTEMLVSSGEVCSYGADERPPKDPQRRPVQTGHSCTVDFDGGQRSSSHVPGAGR